MNTEDPLVAGDDVARVDETLGQEALEAQPEATFDLELDGEVHTLPAALKGAFLRQADYTRKTQELAEHRRAAEAERQTLAAQMQAARSGDIDSTRLSLLDLQLADFQRVDWESFAADDPQAAQAAWAAFQQAGETRDRLAYALAHRGERARLAEAREAAARMEAVGVGSPGTELEFAL